MKEKRVRLTFFSTPFSTFRTFFIMFEMWSGGIMLVGHTVMALKYLYVCNSDIGISNKLWLHFFIWMCSLGDFYLRELAVEY